ncbi:hypothetical protein ACHAXM_000988 [Skeletonema potamos]
MYRTTTYPNFPVQFLLHLSIHRPRTLRSAPLQVYLQPINLLKLFPFLLQFPCTVNGTLNPLPRPLLDIILLHDIIMNIGIATIKPFQLSRLGKEGVFILRFSR